jgi:hypothetical protein
MTSFRSGMVVALALFASSLAVVPAASQQADCAQVGKNGPQVCDLKPEHIDNLKKLLDQFQADNQKSGAVPEDAANCSVVAADVVIVDHFKPTCVTRQQATEVSTRIEALKKQSPQ